MNKKKAFTLVEILVVVALIAILATITFIAINPAENFKDTRNAQRSSHTTEILNAMSQYVSRDGNTIDDIPTEQWSGSVTNPADGIPLCDGTDSSGETFAIIGDYTPTPTIAATYGTTIVADLDAVLVSQFIVGIPIDPLTGDTDAGGSGETVTGYTICEAGGGRVTIAAPDAEDTIINVSR